MGSPTGGLAWGYGVAVSPGYVWVCGAFSDEVNVAGNVLTTPAQSLDPVFIAGFDTYGNYTGSAALQSGSDKQARITCDAAGSVYVCSDYTYPCHPFIIADDELANVAENESWLYLAKYVPPASSGPGSGGGPYTWYTKDTTSFCQGDSTYLRAPSQPGFNYHAYVWNDGTTDSVLSVKEPGTYWVKGFGDGNTAMVDTFIVIAEKSLCDCRPLLPNAFTPNGDGMDDTYRPIFTNGCNISHYAFSIYNRWGQRVFYTEDPYGRWDGTFQGVPADLDTYMFYLIYSTNPNYPEHRKKGDVTLIR